MKEPIIIERTRFLELKNLYNSLLLEPKKKFQGPRHILNNLYDLSTPRSPDQLIFPPS